MKYGLNLYSIRNYLDTEENFLAALEQHSLKAVGPEELGLKG